ncbi:carotenoid oxygenase [Achaetomium macrosporum]|uniref:Carotenoid oxygenase n=1 Tax=Achaetomium macrosporum TaxID=79813 RepID=A0AAN7C617_9PEZI|nr:carotenoid oxygenase [Achaetomium macrosporum]
MASLERPSGEPVRRSKAEEEVDFEQSVQHFVRAAFSEWPNDAGFEGLTEERGPINIPVLGNIPQWVAGSLYRTGPGEHKIEGTPDGTYYTSHWFDGLAHTHRFDISPDDNGEVTVHYSSRRQSDQWVEHIRKHGNRGLVTFGQRSDPCLGLFSKMMATWRARKLAKGDEFVVNPNVAVIPNFPGLGAAGPSSSPGDRASTGHRAALPENVWLTTDNSVLTQVDPRTLEPIGRATQQVLHPDLKGPMSCAHAQRDPATGDVFNWNLEPGREATYRIFRVRAATGKTEILAVIRGGRNVKAAYIHSFYLSASFVVLCIPCSHYGWDGLKVAWEGNLLDAIEPFDTRNKCQWFVVDRHHGRGVVARFETDAGFFFHTVNAFEQRTEEDISRGTTTLFCDVVEYANLAILSQLYYDVLLQRNDAAKNFFGDETRVRNSRARLTRYAFVVPKSDPSPTATELNVSTATETKTPALNGPLGQVERLFSIPAPHAGELPTINPRFATRRHRYVYGLAAWGRSTVGMDGIVKTDTLTREALYWHPPQGHSPGEAIFVPRPEAQSQDEDDGVLLSVVLDGHARRSYLLCLDARSMKELGRAEVGFAVAIGLHGVHVSSVV